MMLKPEKYYPLRNRRKEVKEEKILDLLIRLKAACTKGEKIGTLDVIARSWRLSPVVTQRILEMRILVPAENGHFTWNGLNNLVDPNKKMVELVCKEVDHYNKTHRPTKVSIKSATPETTERKVSRQAASLLAFGLSMGFTVDQLQNEETLNELSTIKEMADELKNK